MDSQDLRDCSLFMPKGGGAVFRVGGGVQFSKSMKKGGCFFNLVIFGEFARSIVICWLINAHFLYISEPNRRSGPHIRFVINTFYKRVFSVLFFVAEVKHRVLYVCSLVVC